MCEVFLWCGSSFFLDIHSVFDFDFFGKGLKPPTIGFVALLNTFVACLFSIHLRLFSFMKQSSRWFVLFLFGLFNAV